MPDPSDPRLAALNNIQTQSRTYGRNRRRGIDANEDPAFRAAIEIADPEQRRAALAQYARQRASGLFPPSGTPDTNASDDERMYRDIQIYGGPGDMQTWQSMPLNGMREDSPEATRARTNLGKELLAPRYQERMDEEADRADDLRIEAQDPTLDATSSKPPAIPRGYSEAAEMETPAEHAAEPMEPDHGHTGDGISRIGQAAQDLLIRARRRR